MSRTPESGQPAGKPPSRLARISSWVMVFSLAVSILLFCVSVGTPAPSFALAGLSVLAFLIAFLSGLVRVSCSIFRESQVRLSELLLCVLVVGALAGALTMLIPRNAAPDVRLRATTGLVVFSCLAVAAGAAWGWGEARRRGETRQGRRLMLLVYGWLLVVGCIAGLAALLFFVGH
jgi:hypothetical protein